MAYRHRLANNAAVWGLLLTTLPPSMAASVVFSGRGPCNPPYPCVPNTASWGHFETRWRTWPGQYRPEKDLSSGVGREILPTPPGQPEVQPPREKLPPRPAPGAEEGLPGEIPTAPSKGGTAAPPKMEKIPVPEVPGLEEAPKGLLPPFGRDPIQEGGPSGLLPDLGPGIMPETPRKSDTAPKAKDVLPKEKSILPEEKDLFPKDKDILPREKELLPSPKEPALKATEPDLVPEAPVPSRPESKTKAQAKRAAADGLASNRSTSAAAKPEAKSAAEPPPKPLQADWSTALHPESLSSGDLRTTSYVQSPAPAQQPPTLDGYCPVELCEHERWTPGNPRYKSVYDGRTFLFSGPAQQKRFLSAPGRYVPAYSGNDPVLAVEQKRELPGVTEHCAIYQGRLYMFSSPATLKTFRQKPGRYTEAAE